MEENARAQHTPHLRLTSRIDSRNLVAHARDSSSRHVLDEEVPIASAGADEDVAGEETPATVVRIFYETVTKRPDVRELLSRLADR